MSYFVYMPYILRAIIVIIALNVSVFAYAATFNRIQDADKLIRKTPEELMQDYQGGEINSSQLWFKMPTGEKIRLINLLKERFREEDGVIINKSSEYYTVLLIDLYENNPEFLAESIKAIFAAVAMQNDDFYEEGMSLGESMKKWFGATFLINYQGGQANSVEE